MREDIKISVVVPVYNVEKYLNQCVDSVLAQTYKNIEVILVDDGATDSSPAICDEYAEKDSRVKVVHKKNGGLSSARNSGIKVATGDYLMFIDSDDYWNADFVLRELIDKTLASDADITCFGYREYFDGENTYGKGIDNIALAQCSGEGFDLLEKMFSKGVFISSACTKIVKSNLIQPDTLFVEGITSEDIDWTARLLIKARSFSVYPNSFYVYRQRNNSIVHSIKYENLKMLADNIIRCLDYSKDIKDAKLLKLYYNYVSYQYISFLRVALLCEGDSRTKTLFKEMKQYRWLLNYHLNRKVKIVYYFNKFLGYNLMFKALK